jgi:DNA-directed RNA polymerase specialized sigma24 family protein
MTPLPDLADAELAQLIAVSARLPVEQRAAFVQRVAAALAAGEISLLGAIAAAQPSRLSAKPSWHPTARR